MPTMHYGATPITFARAQQLRKQETPAEKAFWEKVSNKKMGVKFRRQHPLHLFIADFYCHELRLVVEVDGGIHRLKENVKYDKMRTEIIEEFNVRVIRFDNCEVLNGTDEVLNELHAILDLRRIALSYES